jgi:hypothetical protein
VLLRHSVAGEHERSAVWTTSGIGRQPPARTTLLEALDLRGIGASRSDGVARPRAARR